MYSDNFDVDHFIDKCIHHQLEPVFKWSFNNLLRNVE